MCGIVGYVGLDTAPDGNKFDHNAYDVVLEGLRRQEYRGYDSAGVALVCPDGIVFRKKAGKLLNLENEVKEHPLPDSQIGIGHTRWATHGGPTDNNAHPHVVDNGRLAVVHNGIIENFAELRAELLAEGVEFASQTDTEVAAATIASIYNKLGTGDLTEAVRVASNRLEGAFTILAIHADHPDRVVATRRNSPLVIGLGENENFLGSDVSAFIDYTKEAVEMGQDQIVTITGTDYSIIDFEGTPAEGKPFHIEWDAAAAEKGGFNSFMEKEIHEQPTAVEQTLMGRLDENGNLTLDELNIDDSVLRTIDKIIVVACGTAAYAGQVARYAIEHWCRIPTEVELAHEFRYRDPIVNEKTLIVALSQSGETMDTLMAVRHPRFDPAPRIRRRVVHPRRPRNRSGIHQGIPGTDYRSIPARPVPSTAARQQVQGRNCFDPRRVAEHARKDPEGHRQRHPGQGTGRRNEGCLLRDLPRPPRGLPRRNGRRTQAQGNHLYPR